MGTHGTTLITSGADQVSRVQTAFCPSCLIQIIWHLKLTSGLYAMALMPVFKPKYSTLEEYNDLPHDFCETCRTKDGTRPASGLGSSTFWMLTACFLLLVLGMVIVFETVMYFSALRQLPAAAFSTELSTSLSRNAMNSKANVYEAPRGPKYPSDRTSLLVTSTLIKMAIRIWSKSQEASYIQGHQTTRWTKIGTTCCKVQAPHQCLFTLTNLCRAIFLHDRSRSPRQLGTCRTAEVLL